MSLARATSRWSYRALHAHACGMSLPAVVVHERHRGGNSTPLDIPVAARSGPVTEIQRRIGVAVYLLPTGWTAPHALAESEVSQIATAAVMGLGGGEPAVGHHKPPSRPARFVGQGGADPAEACLVHTASERPPPHATGHRGNVEVFDDDGPVASGKAGGEDMDGLAAQVGRSPVQGRQLGFAWRCPRDPTMRRDACRATRRRCRCTAIQGAGWVTRSMLSSAWAIAAHSAPMPRSIPQRPCGSRGLPGACATIVATDTKRRPLCSLRVIDSTRARPFVSSRTSRRVFSLLRSLPMTGRVR